MMLLRKRSWPKHSTGMDDAERRAVMRVMESGDLSGFGATLAGNRGGKENQALEEETAYAFGVRGAVTMNSATSGLIAAVGALMLKESSSFVVTPYSMSASVACLLPWGHKPRFSDISDSDYCLTSSEPQRIHVDLFGNLSLNLETSPPIIEDAAQAPGATLNGRYAGTFGKMGILSLNKYKQWGCGEGGIVLTDDDELALILRLIRNHAEVLIDELHHDFNQDVSYYKTLYGFNFRLPEISAAIAREQLKKLPALISERQDQATYLTERLRGANGLVLPYVEPNVKSGWYRYAILCPDVYRRNRIVAILHENGIWAKAGYVRPIHRQPIYGEQMPLPVVERVEREMLLLAPFGPGVERADLDDMATIIMETR